MCRHVMMLTSLLSVLMSDGVLIKNMNVFEIGGGYGNMARIMAKSFLFLHWTIFDMSHCTQIQQWFLHKSLGDSVYVHSTVGYGHTLPSNNPFLHNSSIQLSTIKPTIHLVDSRNMFSYGLQNREKLTVVIATHSWSELPWEEFVSYWYLVKRAQYILYSTQMSFPSSIICSTKIDTIKTCFDVAFLYKTEGGNVWNYVFKKNVKLKCR